MRWDQTWKLSDKSIVQVILPQNNGRGASIIGLEWDQSSLFDVISAKYQNVYLSTSWIHFRRNVEPITIHHSVDTLLGFCLKCAYLKNVIQGTKNMHVDNHIRYLSNF